MGCGGSGGGACRIRDGVMDAERVASREFVPLPLPLLRVRSSQALVGNAGVEVSGNGVGEKGQKVRVSYKGGSALDALGGVDGRRRKWWVT